ncbi:Signal transduction response regulator, receiver domain-containing protein [Desulfonema limicola]|uniref:Signal transduction response regulator, receiver domain-containing protein n=1 Tax=Desulfonema limicola TaxID=45656 RepID=A0A975GJ28_9BACT|nr:response regulator [Desulfonema limicola]QTA83205.1 Signal transduction response regulator, receiver domain-containing protein [Desulfonema limicola]
MISYTIYLIDDEPSICKGISFALKKLYRIKTFADAESAIEFMQKEMPDLVLLDISLPGMDGIQALERIRYICPDILVIMVSAYEDKKTVVSAMDMGAQNYLFKPFHLASLKAAIKNAFAPNSFYQTSAC